MEAYSQGHAGSETNPPYWNESLELLGKLPELSVEERRNSIELLARNPSPWIRQRALRMGATLLPDAQLVTYLRNEADDIVRNIGLEILKLKGSKAFSLTVSLLADPDDDVALQAILVLDHLKDPRALEPLRRVLSHSNPNLVQSAIVAVGHLGDDRVIADLIPFLKSDPWLQMAAIQALGDLRSSGGVRCLKPLLIDMMLGPLVAEALAHIGGSSVYRLLAQYFLKYREQVDVEQMLGWIAHVAEGLPSDPPEVPLFTRTLVGLLNTSEAPIRQLAARILLRSGNDPDSEELALEVLAENLESSPPLPACLARRTDLIGRFLRSAGATYGWGLEIALRQPRHLAADDLIAAVRNPSAVQSLEQVVELLQKGKGVQLAAPVLALYLHLPVAQRSCLVPALLKYRTAIRALANESEMDDATQLTLRAVLDGGGRQTAGELCRLPAEDLSAILDQLSHRKKLLRDIPWTSLLEMAPLVYAPLAARAAVAGGMRDLLPALRSTLSSSIVPEVLRCLGELRDRDGVPLLIKEVGHPNPLTRVLVVETLGKIGGPEARCVLRRLLGETAEPNLRIVYRSLSLCAAEEESDVFREGARHHDWMIRLACAEALGRFPTSANLAVLSSLTSDPVTTVAQRALTLLEN